MNSIMNLLVLLISDHNIYITCHLKTTTPKMGENRLKRNLAKANVKGTPTGSAVFAITCSLVTMTYVTMLILQ